MANWWEFPVTQGYKGADHVGVDIGTPFHTALTAILGGTVSGVRYGPFGGELDITTPQGTEDYMHLDQVDVQVGQKISIGELLGLSGGQLEGGQNPAQPPYSSGAHTMFSIFEGAPWASPSIDPTALLLAGPAGGDRQPAVNTLLADPTGSGAVPVAWRVPNAGDTLTQILAEIARLSGLAPLVQGAGAVAGKAGEVKQDFTSIGLGLAGIGVGIQNIPKEIGHGIANALTIGFDDAALFMKRQIVALAVAAVVLLILFA